jgi:hypothetical protein
MPLSRIDVLNFHNPCRSTSDRIDRVHSVAAIANEQAFNFLRHRLFLVQSLRSLGPSMRRFVSNAL